MDTKTKKIFGISLFIGFISSVIYFTFIIILESRSYTSLKINENLSFMIIVSLLNGLFYALISYLFVYFRNKFSNNLRWIVPAILILIALIIYIPTIIFLTIGFLIGLTGF